jgi:hypothetical protein
VKLSWTTSDLSDTVNIVEKETGNDNVIYTIKPIQEDCWETVLFFPAVTDSGIQTDQGKVYSVDPGRNSGFDISVNISGATALGGWSATQRPVYLTWDAVSKLVPEYQNGAYRTTSI